jgi:hypothetical protein
MRCPLCDDASWVDSTPAGVYVDCRTCGDYALTHDAAAAIAAARRGWNREDLERLVALVPYVRASHGVVMIDDGWRELADLHRGPHLVAGAAADPAVPAQERPLLLMDLRIHRNPGYPLNCPQCLEPLTYVHARAHGPSDVMHIYQCVTHGFFHFGMTFTTLRDGLPRDTRPGPGRLVPRGRTFVA